MKILAIESSSYQGNVCLAEGGQVVREGELGEGMRHGRDLVLCIDGLMNDAGWEASELDLIAVDVGPGSFTGLRVGLAIAKTLAFASGTNLVGVPSLDVLAQNAPPSAAYACPALDARRREIHTCLYRQAGGKWEREWDYRTVSISQLCNSLPSGACLLGNALEVFAVEFQKRGDLVFCPKEAWQARARWVARLGLQRYEAGQRDSAHSLVPLYLRLPQVMEK